MTQAKGKLVVLSGPAGVGKTTIEAQAAQRTGLVRSISATTRSPRGSEADGVDYYFIDRQAFERMIRQGELLEHAEVFGQFYGTPAKPVKDAIAAGRSVLLNIDVQGGLQVAKRMPEATFIFIMPPSLDELRRRLEGRATEDASRLEQRLAKAKWEIDTATASGVYRNIVVNDDLAKAVDEVVEIVNRS